jgi:hypothetical protein
VLVCVVFMADVCWQSRHSHSYCQKHSLIRRVFVCGLGPGRSATACSDCTVAGIGQQPRAIVASASLSNQPLPVAAAKEGVFLARDCFQQKNTILYAHSSTVSDVGDV